MRENPGPECDSPTSEVVAAHASQPIKLNAAAPDPAWQKAAPVSFCHDWEYRNCDPQRETQVRVLWSDEMLYLRFECNYRELYVFETAGDDDRHHKLWERDVAEVFLQPDYRPLQPYKEFEVGPNGMWVDLEISPDGTSDLKSGLRRSVFLDERQRRWAAELAIPMKSLTREFDPSAHWGVNFFRIEGRDSSRSYYAWRPTRTPEPDFHVPEAFGRLRFAPAPR